MIVNVNIDLSQEIFAIDTLRALKSSLKHRRKHVLRPLQLYRDQALENFPNDLIRKLPLAAITMYRVGLKLTLTF